MAAMARLVSAQVSNPAFLAGSAPAVCCMELREQRWVQPEHLQGIWEPHTVFNTTAHSSYLSSTPTRTHLLQVQQASPSPPHPRHQATLG